jgi:hypothetical protein
MFMIGVCFKDQAHGFLMPSSPVLLVQIDDCNFPEADRQIDKGFFADACLLYLAGSMLLCLRQPRKKNIGASSHDCQI